MLSSEFDPYVDMLCNELNGGENGPLVHFDPRPTAAVDSGISIKRMTLETEYFISSDGQGGVDVELADGSVTFHDSEIDLQPIADMTVDLGDVQVLGGALSLDLGTVDVSRFVDRISDVIEPGINSLLERFQGNLEGLITNVLLNPNDPLSVAELLEDLILAMGVDTPLEIPTMSSAHFDPPQVRLQTELSEINFSAPLDYNIRTGGMVAVFSSRSSAPRGVSRDPLGSILRNGCYASSLLADAAMPPLTEFFPMEFAQSIDAINQGLFATWWDGGFNFAFRPSDIAPSSVLPAGIGVDTFLTAMDFLVPPILSSCNEDGQLMLEVADIALSGDFIDGDEAHTYTMYATARVPVNWQHTESGPP